MGDLDWLAVGWGQVVELLLEDATEVMEEEMQLNQTHPADVVALSEGATEASPSRSGTVTQQMQAVLRDLAPSAPQGGQSLRMLLAKLAETVPPVAVDEELPSLVGGQPTTRPWPALSTLHNGREVCPVRTWGAATTRPSRSKRDRLLHIPTPQAKPRGRGRGREGAVTCVGSDCNDDYSPGYGLVERSDLAFLKFS